jgi:carbamoyl-phosphate synthase large subunit
MLKNKRIFISGGNGVIGRELVKALVNNEAIVLAGDLKSNTSELPSNIIYRQGDLNYFTKEEFLNFNPEIFIHLAATFERTIESYDFWEENFWHNCRLSNHLMSIAKNSSVLKKVIFASSYLIYDSCLYQFSTPQKKPRILKESDPIYPRNLIGAAKLFHEIELKFLNDFKSEQFKCIIARIYRGYGKGSKDVISRWIRSCLNNEEITVFKKEGIFDYIYAEDTAQGLMRLASDDNVRGIYNLGTGESRSVDDVLTVLKKYFPNLKNKFIESDILYEASQADMNRFKEELHWIPQYNLESAIPIIINYERLKKEFIPDQINNCLVTSISRKVPLINEIKKAARKIGNIGEICGSDMNEKCLGKYFVDQFWHSRKLTDYSIKEILSELKKRKIKYIIPTRDGELDYWSIIQNELRENDIFTMVSEPSQVKLCLDKLEFYHFCRSINIPAIQTSIKIQDINANKYVVKERFGSGSIQIGLKLSKEEAIDISKELDDPIFQPFIEGSEFSFDSYIDRNGLIKGVILRKRDMVVDGESQVTTIVHDIDIEKEIKIYLNAFHFYGHIVGQFILDSSKKMNLIEINSRFGGASTVSTNAGLDSFYWFFLESQGKDLLDYPFLAMEKKIRQIRFPSDYHIILP